MGEKNSRKGYNMGCRKMLIDEIKFRLREAIQRCELSQKEIAKRVGVNPSTISKYVHMEKYPSIDTFAKLCRVLNIASDSILGLDDQSD